MSLPITLGVLMESERALHLVFHRYDKTSTRKTYSASPVFPIRVAVVSS
jgi:hypothetical protein